MELKITKNSIDEKKIQWNPDIQRWELTLEYVKTLVDACPYKTDSVAKRRIAKTSVRIYNWIIRNSASVNRQVIDFLLNKTENGQRFLIEVLAAQMEADMEYGYNDLVVRPVINAQNNNNGNRDEIILNAISMEAELLIADCSLKYFGFNICYMDALPWYLFDLARKYED